MLKRKNDKRRVSCQKRKKLPTLVSKVALMTSVGIASGVSGTVPVLADSSVTEVTYRYDTETGFTATEYTQVVTSLPETVQIFSNENTTQYRSINSKLTDYRTAINGFRFKGYIIGKPKQTQRTAISKATLHLPFIDFLNEKSFEQYGEAEDVRFEIGDQTVSETETKAEYQAKEENYLDNVLQEEKPLQLPQDVSEMTEPEVTQAVVGAPEDSSTYSDDQNVPSNVEQPSVTEAFVVPELETNESDATILVESDSDEALISETSDSTNENNTDLVTNASGDAIETAQLQVSLGDTVRQTASIQVALNQSSVKTKAMTELANLRRDMYQNVNPKFNGTDLRSYLATQGITSAEQYATLFTWNNSLERLAIQRAVETGVHRQIAHLRANGESIFTARDLLSGQSFNSEIIQWGLDIQAALTNANGFAYGEVDALNSANGYANSANGHLHTLLDPAYRSYGFASISHPDFRYGQVTLGLARRTQSIDETGTSLDGTYEITYATGS
ncbi:hypothetical protein [Streptococcus moroccensis]|uniref:Uncharacterized protein YkwD n=1 Tax=Streptococcus moroccensis TaxID=1451356 RepID=A0ABT9YRF0_9STRE|nr:hypothetical protein [Streptococcus moroccensis]MDQ0221690.1 uncharacterized protein YkwD [Streptococcus moroccensis]